MKAEYEKCIKTNSFHKRVDYYRPINYHVEDLDENNQADQAKKDQEMDSGDPSYNESNLKTQTSILEEIFVFHSPSVMLHYNQPHMLDELGNLSV
jgi:hypothetical protein